MKQCIMAFLLLMIAMPIGIATAAANTVPPAPAAKTDGSPHIFVLTGNSWTEISQAQAQPFMSQKPHGGAFPFMAPSIVIVQMTYALNGAHSSVTAPQLPVFDINIAGVSWADPGHITPVLLQFGAGNAKRIIGTQTTHVHVASGMETVDPISDQRVPIKVEAISQGHYRITPAQPLPSGEYAVAFRDPDVAADTFSSTQPGASHTNESKQQMYQLYAWDFSVGSTGSAQP